MKKRKRIPQAKLTHSVNKVTTGSVSNILTGLRKLVFNVFKVDSFSSSDLA